MSSEAGCEEQEEERKKDVKTPEPTHARHRLDAPRPLRMVLVAGQAPGTPKPPGKQLQHRMRTTQTQRKGSRVHKQRRLQRTDAAAHTLLFTNTQRVVHRVARTLKLCRKRLRRGGNGVGKGVERCVPSQHCTAGTPSRTRHTTVSNATKCIGIYGKRSFQWCGCWPQTSPRDAAAAPKTRRWAAERPAAGTQGLQAAVHRLKPQNSVDRKLT